MDHIGFRTYLESRKVPIEKMADALAMAEQFERFAENEGGFTAETAMAFSRQLIEEGQNSEENLVTLARYGWFIRNTAVYVAILELLDGAEAQVNLFQRVAEGYGEDFRDEVFDGIGLAPLGLPTPEKPGKMQSVIERLEQILGPDACRNLLRDSLRDLPDEYYVGERELFLSCDNVDDYLTKKKQRFLVQMEACQREGRLFFAQEVTDEVLSYIHGEQEMGGGMRVGDLVYETKIPFLTKEFLAESDPLMKRYYYCHCPWAREAIRSGEKVAPIFCNCSAGFHKKPWEMALNQKIQVDVLESVLRGDPHCRFVIHLPE